MSGQGINLNQLAQQAQPSQPQMPSQMQGMPMRGAPVRAGQGFGGFNPILQPYQAPSFNPQTFQRPTPFAFPQTTQAFIAAQQAAQANMTPLPVMDNSANTGA